MLNIKYKTSLLVITIVLTGCGEDTNITKTKIPTEIVVERGAVYDSKVSDSKGNIATEKDGTNIYLFSDTPVYPITAIGGWIDVDGDGNKTTSDIELDLKMVSYTTNITSVTTYIADKNKSVREEKINHLKTIVNLPTNELLKVPSNGTTQAMILNNAIYKQIKLNDNNITNLTLNDINESYNKLYTIINQRADITKIVEQAKLIEQDVISELVDKIIYCKENYTNIKPINTKKDKISIKTQEENNYQKNDNNSTKKIDKKPIELAIPPQIGHLNKGKK